MESIIDYNMNKTLRKNYIFLGIISLIIIVLIIFLKNYNYKQYSKTFGTVHLIEDKFYVDVYVKTNELDNFLKEKNIMINNEYLFYGVVNISKDLIINEGQNYNIVTIQTVLSKKDMIENNIVEISYMLEDIKLMKKIIKLIGG